MTKARHCFKSGCSYAQDGPKLDSDAAVIYNFFGWRDISIGLRDI